MNLLISGYGVSAPRSTALIQTDGKISRTVWEDNIDAASYAAFSDGLLFVISEWEQGSAIRLLKWESGAFHFRDEIRVPEVVSVILHICPDRKFYLEPVMAAEQSSAAW